MGWQRDPAGCEVEMARVLMFGFTTLLSAAGEGVIDLIT
jgi:hypothetical protein